MNTPQTPTAEPLAPLTGSALTDAERLDEIRAEALSETYAGELDLGHVSLPDVLDWIRIMSPVYAAKVGWPPLMDFDVNSILRTFEEWTQGKHDKELNVKDHSPIGAVGASNTESNSAAPIG